MKVRFARSEDRKQVLELLDEFGIVINKKISYSRGNTEAQKVGGPIFNEIIKRKDTMIFLAVEKGNIIGLATFYLLPNIRHGWNRGHVEDFIVSEKMRRKGTGSKLMKSIKIYCRKNKIKVIKLDTALELKEAHRFYEKNGGKYTEKMYRFDIK